mmetsp:Transcript_14213/g.44745  ORF Transcript_14213/g.44745 Transcript_14213/m.44745 type:complete len:289 (+) Transcript_14213:220-1086(+)
MTIRRLVRPLACGTNDRILFQLVRQCHRMRQSFEWRLLVISALGRRAVRRLSLTLFVRRTPTRLSPLVIIITIMVSVNQCTIILQRITIGTWGRWRTCRASSRRTTSTGRRRKNALTKLPRWPMTLFAKQSLRTVPMVFHAFGPCLATTMLTSTLSYGHRVPLNVTFHTFSTFSTSTGLPTTSDTSTPVGPRRTPTFPRCSCLRSIQRRTRPCWRSSGCGWQRDYAPPLQTTASSSCTTLPSRRRATTSLPWNFVGLLPSGVRRLSWRDMCMRTNGCSGRKTVACPTL